MTANDPSPPAPRGIVRRGRKNLMVFVCCSAFVAAMVGASYAAVPLYYLFCAATGYGGTTSIADGSPVEPINRMVTVRFDANSLGDLPWTFKPVKRSVSGRVGEVLEASYMVTNTSDETIWGRATFNVTPLITGAYFSKLYCFCFDSQKLEPHETREMPVAFYVDPSIADDHEADSIRTITLSYTFFRIPPPDAPPVARSDNSAKPGPRMAVEQADGAARDRGTITGRTDG